MTTKTAQEILPGDRWEILHGGQLHEVTAVRAPEPTEDPFGRTMLKIFCKSGGREGWMIYGPAANIGMIGD